MRRCRAAFRPTIFGSKHDDLCLPAPTRLCPEQGTSARTASKPAGIRSARSRGSRLVVTKRLAPWRARFRRIGTMRLRMVSLTSRPPDGPRPSRMAVALPPGAAHRSQNDLAWPGIEQANGQEAAGILDVVESRPKGDLSARGHVADGPIAPAGQPRHGFDGKAKGGGLDSGQPVQPEGFGRRGASASTMACRRPPGRASGARAPASSSTSTRAEAISPHGSGEPLSRAAQSPGGACC